jgi:hypothetical protein
MVRLLAIPAASSPRPRLAFPLPYMSAPEVKKSRPVPPWDTSHDLSSLPTPLADVRNNGVHAILYLPDLSFHFTERIVAGYGQGAADILCETHDVRTQSLQVVADLADRCGLCPFLPG